MSSKVEYQAEYRALHAEAHRAYCRAYYQSNKDKMKRRSSEYRKANKEKVSKANKAWRALNGGLEYRRSKYWERREIILEQKRAYYRRTKQAILERHRAYHKAKQSSCPQYRIRRAMRSRLSHAMAALCSKKSAATMNLVGCDPAFLCCFLERQFLPGMSWENYGTWHVDHRIPCASFDLTNPADQVACFHYSNLQPLWAIDNLRKWKN